MEAAMPNPDPFHALTTRFAALDAQHEREHRRGKQVLKNGRDAVRRLKDTAERTASGDTPSRTRLCIKTFSESDVERAENIEHADGGSNGSGRLRELPETEELSREEMLDRLDKAAEEAVSEDP